MGWPVSLLIASITAIATAILAGFIASLSVDWYQVSSREGAAGYFVIGIAFLGLVAGFLIGLVVSRQVAGRPDPGFLKAIAISLGIVAAAGGASALVARSLADIAPTLDGNELFLAVEVRWPAGQAPVEVSSLGDGFLGLGSITGSNVRRAYSRGPLWLEDAREVDGRWVVPGAVELFTKRGRRSIDLGADSSLAGFLVPLPANPSSRYLEWSRWYPEPPPGAPAWPTDKFSYRFRVRPRTEPIRTETVGSFEISTIASYFFDADVEGRRTIAASAEFAIRHRGQQVAMEVDSAATGDSAVAFERADQVAVIPGPEPALLVHVPDRQSSGYCFLIREEGSSTRVMLVGESIGLAGAFGLTNDPSSYRTNASREALGGRIDRARFAQPGLYLVGQAIVDTRRLAVRHFSAAPDVTLIPSVRPLGVSPDERSYLRFVYAGGTAETAALLVTDVVADSATTIPIDHPRMRYRRLDALDPAWVLHHFQWRRGPEGVDRLVERESFVPIPYRGELSNDGGATSYRLEPAGQPLREALVQFLVTELHGERLPADAGAYQYPVKIGDQVISVAAGSFEYVSVSLATTAGDSSIIAVIARRFDAVLATGKYDSLFGIPRS